MIISGLDPAQMTAPADSFKYRAINSKHPKHRTPLPLCPSVLDGVILILLTMQPCNATIATTLHIPSPRNPNRLTTHIRKQWTGNRQHSPRRFLGTSRPSQWNVRILLCFPSIRSSSTLAVLQLFPRNPQRNLRPVRRRHVRAVFLSGCETGLDEAEGNGVGAHVECGAPFFGDGFG
jgi:hypothetical protein